MIRPHLPSATASLHRRSAASLHCQGHLCSHVRAPPRSEPGDEAAARRRRCRIRAAAAGADTRASICFAAGLHRRPQRRGCAGPRSSDSRGPPAAPRRLPSAERGGRASIRRPGVRDARRRRRWSHGQLVTVLRWQSRGSRLRG